MKASYREYAPSAILQPFVDCYWYHSFEAGAANEESPVQRCLPLGMIEIIFSMGNPCLAKVDENWQTLPKTFVVGLYRDTVLWKGKGACSKFGIRLTPESLMKLFKVPACSLFSTFTDLPSFFNTKTDELTEKIAGLQDVASMINLCEEFLQRQLKHMRNERNYVFEATKLIRQYRGNMTIESLSEYIYISRRQLERGFKEHFGTSPKTYMRIIRFRNAFTFFNKNAGETTWTDVSYQFGYADQAHFIRDFKEFVGEVPSAFFENEKQIYQRSLTA